MCVCVCLCVRHVRDVYMVVNMYMYIYRVGRSVHCRPVVVTRINYQDKNALPGPSLVTWPGLL